MKRKGEFESSKQSRKLVECYRDGCGRVIPKMTSQECNICMTSMCDYCIVYCSSCDEVTCDECLSSDTAYENMCYLCFRSRCEKCQRTRKGVLQCATCLDFCCVEDWKPSTSSKFEDPCIGQCNDCNANTCKYCGSKCSSCDCILCDMCEFECDFCDKKSCSLCSEMCENCSERMCRYSIRHCINCGKLVCENCLNKNVCADCESDSES